MLENVSLTGSRVDLDSWGYTNHLSPAVYAGLLIGEAEGGTTVRGDIELKDYLGVHADYSLADQDLRLGGGIGWVHGDIELSGIKVNDLYVRIDARTDQDGYTPADGAPPLAGGGLIGWADGNVTLSDISMTDVSSDVIRREGGDPLPSYAGGFVAYCGGDLTARSVSLAGEYANVDAQPEQGDAYGGGLCGYCGGGAEVSDSRFSLTLSPMFHGDTLYESNVLGYVCGDASFLNVQADCGIEEYTGESRANSIIATSHSTYYLAALAGGAEGSVSADGCVIDVHYNLMNTPKALHDGTADGAEGCYNHVS